MHLVTLGQLWQETWEWGQILRSFRTPFVVIFDGFRGSKDDPLKMSLWFTEKWVFGSGYFVPGLSENVATVVNMEWRNNYGIFQMVCRLSFKLDTMNQERQSVIVKNECNPKSMFVPLLARMGSMIWGCEAAQQTPPSRPRWWWRTLGRLTPGSNLTESGSVKMYSGLMGGMAPASFFGSVGAISGVKSPILVA